LKDKRSKEHIPEIKATGYLADLSDRHPRFPVSPDGLVESAGSRRARPLSSAMLGLQL
jgi:hypothetical protein